MEAAAAAGEWKQAEQARLEAYAFFEFGPELSLRSLAPDVVARVEGLVWFGADGEEGLAKLIAAEAAGARRCASRGWRSTRRCATAPARSARARARPRWSPTPP